MPLKLNAPLLRRFRQALPARSEAFDQFSDKSLFCFCAWRSFFTFFFLFLFFFFVLSEDAYVRDMVFSAFSHCKQLLC